MYVFASFLKFAKMDFNTSFKSAQTKFYDWATKWTQEDENPESNRTPDLVDLITIFQILGFTISLVDSHNPHEMSALSCGQRGLKINISCSHSGVRFVLEGVNICSCSEKMVNYVQETMSNPDAVQRNETYSKMRLLNVPEGEKVVIQTVLTHLVHMMHSAAKQNDQNQNMVEAAAAKICKENQNMVEPVAEIYEENKILAEVLAKDNIENKNKNTDTPSKIQNQVFEGFFTPGEVAIKEKSPKLPISPGRHRSLDTLTGKNPEFDEFPKPGQLNKNEESEVKPVPAITYSSPNLSTIASNSKPTKTSSPVTNMAVLKQGYSKLLSVQELVRDVIDIFEKSQEIPKLSIDLSTIGIKASTESLIVKKPQLTSSNSDSNLVSKKMNKPLCRPSIRSTSSIKSTASSTTSTSNSALTVKSSTSGRKSSENISPTLKTNTISNKLSTVASALKSQKYAHVKSTIPKGNAAKK